MQRVCSPPSTSASLLFSKAPPSLSARWPAARPRRAVATVQVWQAPRCAPLQEVWGACVSIWPSPAHPQAATEDGESNPALAQATRRIQELGRSGRPKDAVNELAQLARCAGRRGAGAGRRRRRARQWRHAAGSACQHAAACACARRLGVQPDSRAATAVLHACASNRKMELAREIFDELFGAHAGRPGAAWRGAPGSGPGSVCPCLQPHTGVCTLALAKPLP
jgi:hypothetical protein